MIQRFIKRRFNLVAVSLFFLIFPSLSFQLDSKYKRSRLRPKSSKTLRAVAVDSSKESSTVSRWGVVAAGAAAGAALTLGISKLLSTKDERVAVFNAHNANINAGFKQRWGKPEAESCQSRDLDLEDSVVLQNMAQRLDVLKLRHKDLLERQGIDCTTPTILELEINEKKDIS